MFDLGFVRVQEGYTEQKSSLPIKKEKGCELTPRQKEYNKNHPAKDNSSEHAICRPKKCRIISEAFRKRFKR